MGEAMAAVGGAAQAAIAGTSSLTRWAAPEATNAAARASFKTRPARFTAPRAPPRPRPQRWRGPSALFDRGSETKKDDKKFISKEEEPEEFWQTEDEKEGKNPMSTPLPYIAILSLLTPFAILAVAFANNWIKAPVR